ncbi:unnamed protein product, partial [marine sediment metagenome]
IFVAKSLVLAAVPGAGKMLDMLFENPNEEQLLVKSGIDRLIKTTKHNKDQKEKLLALLFIPSVSRYYEKDHPLIKEYVFNVESMIIKKDLEVYHRIIGEKQDQYPFKKNLNDYNEIWAKNLNDAHLDGIYLPFKNLKGLKRNDFMVICGLIYDLYEKEFEYNEISSESIISYVNLYLIRDIEEIVEEKIPDLFIKALDYLSLSTVKSGIGKIRELYNVPPLR